MTKYEILKEGVRIYNPFVPGIPAAGMPPVLYDALGKIFVGAGMAFSGSIQEVVDLAEEGGYSDRAVRMGFRELQDSGYLTLEGDKFVPTQKFLDQLR